MKLLGPRVTGAVTEGGDAAGGGGELSVHGAVRAQAAVEEPHLAERREYGGVKPGARA